MQTTSTTRQTDAKRERAPQEAFTAVRQASLSLCAPLTVEDHNLQAMPDASPAKWHLAHTTWFFETFLLNEYLPEYKTVNPAFRNLFNSYYNAVGDRPLRTMRHVLSRPSLDDVHAYRAHVDAAMERLLRQDLSGEALDLIALGHEPRAAAPGVDRHRREVRVGANPLRPAYEEVAAREATGCCSGAELAKISWRRLLGGIRGEGFSFDNEGPQHKVYVQPFRLASRLVTNGEYLEFMRDGGLRHGRVMALRWMGHGARQSVERSAVLGETRRRMVALHAGRHAACESRRAGVPRELLRGRCVCALGGRAAGHRV